jgi:GNAT superfamily N-acetyltransferase
MIRPACIADLPRLVEMGRRFRGETTYHEYLADNPEKMAELATKLIATDGLLVAERDGRVIGMLGYIIHTHFISGQVMGGEIFWWTDPESRGDGLKLLREAERRAKLSGATQMQMIAPNEKVARLYERRKYQFVEATYQRAL